MNAMTPDVAAISHDIIHMPQKLQAVLTRAFVIFLEVIFVPGAILAILGGAGQVTLGIVLVFAWRILVGLARLSLVGLIPVTSILSFAFLSARTGMGGAMGLTDAGSPLIAYILPGCIVGALTGVYFMHSSFTDKPLIMKLANDFVDLTDESRARLMVLFQRLTFIAGFLNLALSVLGVAILFSMGEAQASVLVGSLGIAGPVLIVLVCALVAILTLRSLCVRISFKDLPAGI